MLESFVGEGRLRTGAARVGRNTFSYQLRHRTFGLARLRVGCRDSRYGPRSHFAGIATFQGIPGSRPTCIPSGVSLDRIFPLADGGPLFTIAWSPIKDQSASQIASSAIMWDKETLLRKLEVPQRDDEAKVWQTSRWVGYVGAIPLRIQLINGGSS